MITKETPSIVAKIYEKGKDWENALKFYKISHMPSTEREKILAQYKVDNELFSELRLLSPPQQNQTLAFVRILVQLEPLLRRYVRKVLEENDLDIAETVKTVMSKKEYVRNEPALFPIDRIDDLELLTLDQLFKLIIMENLWALFSSGSFSRDEWITAKNLLRPIRIKLAHSIQLNEEDFTYCKIADRLVMHINRFLENSRTASK